MTDLTKHPRWPGANPGMLLVTAHTASGLYDPVVNARVLSIVDHDDRLALVYVPGEPIGDSVWSIVRKTAIPDYDDAGTQGVLLAMLADALTAQGRPGMKAATRMVRDRMLHGLHGDDEMPYAQALVAALAEVWG